MEEYVAATAPTFATLPRNASPAQMMKQYNLKEQAVAQYPVGHCGGAYWISGAAYARWVSDSKGFTDRLPVSFFKYSCACPY